MKRVLCPLFIFLCIQCGEKTMEEEKPATVAIAFSDISGIISQSCGTASCHGAKANQTLYVGSESNLKANKANVIKRSYTDKDMPPANSGFGITTDERKTIRDFLMQ